MRMQTSNFPTSMSCLRWTLKHEGARGLFAGISSPMVSSIIFSAILFGSYENFKELFSQVRRASAHRVSGRGYGPPTPHPVAARPRTFRAGRARAPSGGFRSPETSRRAWPLASWRRRATPRSNISRRSCRPSTGVLVRTARVKRPLQAQSARRLTRAPGRPKSTHRRSRPVEASLWSTLRHMYEHGGIRGAYTGYVAQLLRECPGNVVYFGTYTASRTHLPSSFSDASVGAHRPRLVAGGAPMSHTRTAPGVRSLAPFSRRPHQATDPGRGRHLWDLLLVGDLPAGRGQVPHAGAAGTHARPASACAPRVRPHRWAHGLHARRAWELAPRLSSGSPRTAALSTASRRRIGASARVAFSAGSGRAFSAPSRPTPPRSARTSTSRRPSRANDFARLYETGTKPRPSPSLYDEHVESAFFDFLGQGGPAPPPRLRACVYRGASGGLNACADRSARRSRS